MESHLEFEVYGLILYLAFIFAKIRRFFGSAELCKILFSERFCLNGGHHVSGFIQKVETVVF